MVRICPACNEVGHGKFCVKCGKETASLPTCNNCGEDL